ncbi:hypothetical protein F383_28516 [Gossypium arboreum]|uniref:Uncharacterized protein n=1 Tax=Gossypium arboreum TaxID=29729 RepID=A0A0B0MZY3_GOSAR|nr:hypothetical protein F383_28516 [Gossypium arboreum]
MLGIKKSENQIWIGGKLKLSTGRPALIFHRPRFWIKLRAWGSSVKFITLSTIFGIL